MAIVTLYSTSHFYRQLVVANEWRIMALDEVDEDAIYRVCFETFSSFP